MDDKDTQYPNPTPGASLILSFRLQGWSTLIIGSGRLAATRAFASLEAGSNVIVLDHGGLKDACGEVRWRATRGQVRVVDWDSLLATKATENSAAQDNHDQEAETLRQFLQDNSDINLVCITDTILSSAVPNSRRSKSSAARLYAVCRSLRIPVNVTDIPDLSDFTFASTHRFEDDQTGQKTCLQVAVTANSQGCRLAGRLRRDIVAKLPKEVGRAADKVGMLRRIAKVRSAGGSSATTTNVNANGDAGLIVNEELEDIEESCEDAGVVPTPNEPVPQRSLRSSTSLLANSSSSSELTETELEAAKRRMKWVAQVSEYWPLPKLAAMSEEAEDVRELFSESSEIPSGATNSDTNASSIHSIHLNPPPAKPGRIILVGSGPGHPSLLTVAAHKALTTLADLVLSDKLVPEAVLSLVPQHVDIKIAKKFPGNAEGAQNELMQLAVEAARRGLTVVRLKQGDPSIFGRAGEEILFFRSRGFEPLVIPGVSSALAGPTFACIPVTQRGVAESFVVSTGVGRNGKEIQLPGYLRSRTLVILMGVARLGQVVNALTEETSVTTRRDGSAYPPHIPIAIIERASMPDQRTVVSTLKDIAKAMESVGEQRPPGMIVIGWSVLALSGEGDVSVLDGGSDGDGERVRRWLGDCAWRVFEGLAEGWSGI